MNKPLTYKELVKLLKICKTDGVSLSLKSGEFELSITAPEKSVMTPAPQARGSAKKAVQITERADLQSQYTQAQEALSTLQLEDPSAYEALLIQGAIGAEQDH